MIRLLPKFRMLPVQCEVFNYQEKFLGLSVEVGDYFFCCLRLLSDSDLEADLQFHYLLGSYNRELIQQVM